MDPIVIFNDWYKEELSKSRDIIPSACCLSTLGLDGYPNSRFVSLKEVLSNTFIVTGPMHSRKGLEIAQSNKVSLIFWWSASARQVRIQGEAHVISGHLADTYFAERNKTAQLVSIISAQGKEIRDLNVLNNRFEELENLYANKNIERPLNWGGYSIRPIRIEFMEFKTTRFHIRRLFERKNDQWSESLIQP
ncbi:MAG: pyridoxal 5'-phosphate synthase [Cyclobacteriaceae bacterium]